MTTQTFKPDGRFHSESKNLRGVIDNARRRGVSRVVIQKLKDSRYATLCKVTYHDRFYSLCNFADSTICFEFFNRRWPAAIDKSQEVRTP